MNLTCLLDGIARLGSPRQYLWMLHLSLVGNPGKETWSRQARLLRDDGVVEAA